MLNYSLTIVSSPVNLMERITVVYDDGIKLERIDPIDLVEDTLLIRLQVT